MNIDPIIIVPGEPKSIFFEIFFKSLKKIRIVSPLILICSNNLFKGEAKKFNFKNKIEVLDRKYFKAKPLLRKKIYLINVELKTHKISIKKRHLINQYIKECFKISFELINNGCSKKFINGPIIKENFLSRKYLGITEYLGHKFQVNKIGMLIFNEKLSVCPLTTHLPVSQVSKKISVKSIVEKILLIHDFYVKKFFFKPKIGVLGLNPHCETKLKFNEDKEIILKAIHHSKLKKINVKGPFPADTFFMKDNRKNYDVALGMYHDQVLTPLKTLYEYDAINITMGLPFMRVTPDHGPNTKMVDKNISNPNSLIKCLKFLNKSV